MATYVYVAVAGDQKLLLFDMEPDTGRLAAREEYPLDGRSAAICTDPSRETLYLSVNSDPTVIVSYRIDQLTGSLTQLGEVEIGGDACFISTDNTGRFLMAASYGAGMVSVMPTGDDGVARGPVVDYPTAGLAHFIQTDASNRYAFVPHVDKSNVIFQFLFDEKTGLLTPNAVPKIEGHPGQGPRHLVFHPTKDIVYSDNEQESSVTAYHFDTSRGTLAEGQTLSTLPEEGFDGENSNAQIRIHPTGKAIYVSNRGHDSIAVFAVDPETGELSSLGQQPTESVPRPFNIDPDGRYLFAGGAATGRVAAYRIEDSGTLDPLEVYEVGDTPSWIEPIKFD